MVSTPYGEPSSPLIHSTLADYPVIFLARHGHSHNIPPHQVNYRANLWALKQTGAQHIVAIASVGSISDDFLPGTLAFPDQIIDYTSGRHQTFFENGDFDQINHIDFTHPYCRSLHKLLLKSAQLAGIDAKSSGAYGATQGPRLETAAEIRRMERDGCHMVGMTGMPEAALARELDLCYAACAIATNPAAGKSTETLTVKAMKPPLQTAAPLVKKLLEALTEQLSSLAHHAH